MFEVGKRYVLRRLIDGQESTSSGRVEAYEFPLLKTADEVFPMDSPYFPGGITRGEIINVSSPSFVGAELSEHQD